LALDLLKRSGLIALPLDKQPGFVLSDPTDFRGVESLALPSSYYRACSDLNTFSLGDRYVRLARSIGAHYDDRDLTTNIASSFDSERITTLLAFKIKAHKAPGEVGVRTIHRGFRQSFHGLSMWVHKVLAPISATIPWLARDSAQVYSTIAQLPITSSSRVTIEDLKDFYLRGDPVDISQTVGKLVDSSTRRLFIEALYFLLENQYGQTTSLDSNFQVISGSGIGLLHSAHVANLYYYAKVEAHLSITSRTAAYLRYHNDIISVHADTEAMYGHFDKKRELHGDIFKSKIAVNAIGHECVFLDLQLTVASPRLLICASQVKPVTPLCPTSAHNFNVHRGWPSAVIDRISSLSGGSDESLSVLYRRYQYANTHPYTLALFKSCAVARKSAQVKPKSVSSLSNCDTRSRCPFVLRYHPLFKVAFGRTLKRVPVPPELNVRVMPAWRNALPSVIGHLNRCSRSALHGRWDG
jgi:hypothetical protein